MSILSDLDPKNSRIQSAANATANSHFKWTIGVLLMLGGAAWLYLIGADKLTAVSRTNEGGTVLSSAAQTLDTPAPHLSAPADQGLNHASNAVGAAVIQNVAPRNPAETQDLPLPKPATPRGRETTAALPMGDSSPTETGKPLPSTTQISPHSDRARTSQPTAKAKTTRNRKLAQAQRQQKNASMAAERDIEIISAIVR